MTSPESSVDRLQEENDRLRAELQKVTEENHVYRKVVQQLLPVEDFDYDLQELQDALAHPEQHQTLGSFLSQVQSELTGRP